MKLLPDLDTSYVDPFRTEKTLNINMSIVDPYTGEPYSRDPRQVAAKAEAYLRSTGVADTAFFAPEAEFYIFDDVRFETKQNAGYRCVLSKNEFLIFFKICKLFKKYSVYSLHEIIKQKILPIKNL